MNANTSTQASKKKSNALPSSSVNSVKSAFNSQNFTLGGISIPELAVLGAAGFVLWRNREKVQTILESQGIEAPWLSSSVGDLVQSGMTMLAGQKIGQGINQATQSKNKSMKDESFHDA